MGNFVAAIAYHFYLAFPATFTQTGARLLAEPCNQTLIGYAFRYSFVPVWRTCRGAVLVMAVGPFIGAAARRSWLQEMRNP